MSALVLSGGGSLGLAHIGVVKMLEQQIQFSHYYGVSAGSIIASALACGHSAQQISDIAHDTKLMSLLFDISKSNFGMMKGEKIMDFLETLFNGKTFEQVQDSGKVLQVFATDFTTGERICLDSGSISLAVRASLSVPLLFEPVQITGKWLTDGGLSGNLPIWEAIHHYKGKKIIAVDVATGLKTIDFSEDTWFGKPKSMRKIMERTFRILFKTQQYFIPYDSRVSYIRPNLSEFTTLDVKKWRSIENAGEEAGKIFLAKEKY